MVLIVVVLAVVVEVIVVIVVVVAVKKGKIIMYTKKIKMIMLHRENEREL